MKKQFPEADEDALDAAVIRSGGYHIYTCLDMDVQNQVDAIYTNLDEGHFTVEATVEVSDLFYGWVLGFGKKAKLIGSDRAVEQFRAYLDKVREMY